MEALATTTDDLGKKVVSLEGDTSSLETPRLALAPATIVDAAALPNAAASKGDVVFRTRLVMRNPLAYALSDVIVSAQLSGGSHGALPGAVSDDSNATGFVETVPFLHRTAEQRQAIDASLASCRDIDHAGSAVLTLTADGSAQAHGSVNLHTVQPNACVSVPVYVRVPSNRLTRHADYIVTASLSSPQLSLVYGRARFSLDASSSSRFADDASEVTYHHRSSTTPSAASADLAQPAAARSHAQVDLDQSGWSNAGLGLTMLTVGIAAALLYKQFDKRRQYEQLP